MYGLLLLRCTLDCSQHACSHVRINACMWLVNASVLTVWFGVFHCCMACCRYPSRLYAGLGVDLWMIKIKGTLAAIGVQPSTYASGRVRYCS
jgi:hypothetical protein